MVSVGGCSLSGRFGELLAVGTVGVGQPFVEANFGEGLCVSTFGFNAALLSMSSGTSAPDVGATLSARRCLPSARLKDGVEFWVSVCDWKDMKLRPLGALVWLHVLPRLHVLQSLVLLLVLPCKIATGVVVERRQLLVHKCPLRSTGEQCRESTNMSRAEFAKEKEME